MIVIENKELEKAVLAGVSCIAVPLEVFVPTSGEAVITTYSFCKDIAKKWEARYFEDILCEEALGWVEEELKTVAENIGYERFFSENESMLEYVMEPGMQMPNFESCVKVHTISSNVVLSALCENSGYDIEIADDGEDLIFAVVENGCILAYAGMNDVLYDDGSVEISVETAPDERRKGYGAACVAALVNHLLNKGIAVRYKCAEENTPSSCLAEKLGFALEGKRKSFVFEKI